MPELPEVEMFVRALQPIVGAKIERVEVLDERLGLDAAAMAGCVVSAVERRGKHIVIQLADRGALVIHLRMSGRLRLRRNETEERYTRMILHLGHGRDVFFVNPRRLGTARYCPGGFEACVGVDPLSADFTPSLLGDLTQRSRSPIKLFLLDQRRVAGMGNIYACEALWRADVSPERIARSLSAEEVGRLHISIVSVLNEAIAEHGTTLGGSVSDYHPDAGESGEFQNHLSVYGREGESCERCGATIVRIKQGGRSTYFCRGCQR